MKERSEPITVAIALGSNLGDRRAHFEGALDRLRTLEGAELLAVSQFVQTEPLARPDGGDPGGPYLNAVAILRTRLSARAVLDALLAIERDAGRIRGTTSERWAARTLDLDLLVYGDQVVEEEGLSVPHPRLHQRAFVLVPLAEVAPDLLVPGAHGGRTAAQLLADLQQGCSA